MVLRWVDGELVDVNDIMFDDGLEFVFDEVDEVFYWVN